MCPVFALHLSSMLDKKYVILSNILDSLSKRWVIMSKKHDSLRYKFDIRYSRLIVGSGNTSHIR